MRLIYLSPVPWESFSQRPHKFVDWFHERTGGPVLWIEPYPTRLPNWNDLIRPRGPGSSSQGRTIPAWLSTLKPGGLPIEPLPGSIWINSRFWRRCFNQIYSFSLESNAYLAIGKPSALAVELLKVLPHCSSLYDAMDDFPAFYSGISRFALAKKEREIAQLANVIWASSSLLKSRWDHFHNDVRLVHNGLDLSTLRAAEPQYKFSDKKIFGYVGTIASWFDWKWLRDLAAERPNDEIRLVGPIFNKPKCRLPTNITLLPACNHTIALRTMMQFDVGLIPFKKNPLTASVDPIKYYEYRGIGLPVITTDFGEMSQRTGDLGVFISRSHKDIGIIAKSALAFKNDTNQTSKFAKQNLWKVRFDSSGLLANFEGE